ncbi:hypothetical protein AVEN_127617-1 [Araneus ventricosus]|uniref:Uncharacterized protein n=1 Tax=Araneus ventricosus TaxID=182803 RepID=A0A4Y2T0B1_ARAVE|nr:hypothetical protein AVEN_127617-1 [Araneus ventricosus]
MNVADLARTRTYNRSTSTFCTILKENDMIEEIVYASKVVRKKCIQRLLFLDDVERFLLRLDKRKAIKILQGDDTIRMNIISEKPKAKGQKQMSLNSFRMKQ